MQPADLLRYLCRYTYNCRQPDRHRWLFARDKYLGDCGSTHLSNAAISGLSASSPRYNFTNLRHCSRSGAPKRLSDPVGESFDYAKELQDRA